jgi:hypothetical protein
MSKLISKAKSSKLKNSLQNIEEDSPQRERVVRQIKPKDFPRSYRFDAEIMNTLKDTLDRVNNELVHKKVSEARLVKALIFLSKEIETDQIIKSLKEIW